jgi:hypothetical protein
VAELPSLKEAVLAEMIGEPKNKQLVVRITTRQYSCLQTIALIDGTEVSSLVRVLINEALAARGIEQGL